MSQSATAAGVPTAVPTRKVLAGGAAGALSAILVFILNSYFLEPHHMKEIDPGIASAITTAISFIVSYLIPPGGNESSAP